MGVKLKKETGEFILDTNYEINFVRLTEPVEEHTHKFVELVYTLGGKGVHTVDGREYRVKGGDMLVINYSARHSVTPLEGLHYVDIMLKPEYVNETLKGTENLFLLLQLRDFSDLSNCIIKDNIFLRFEDYEREKAELLLHWTLEEQAKREAASELIKHSALSMLLCLVFRKMTEKQDLRPGIGEQLLLYMKRNCHSIASVSEIASECGYTAEHFSRKFKEYTGASPTEFIAECRISKAAEMLSETDKPIEYILTECGFSNRTAFFKKFTEAYGTTPLKYRKNQK